MNSELEIIKDGYWRGRWLVIFSKNGNIIKGFDVLEDAIKNYPNAKVNKDTLYDDPG